MRQHISNFEDLAGKTIEAATVVDLQVLLTFTDGTYAAIVSIEEDGCIHAPELTTAKRDTARQADVLGALGIANQADKTQWKRERDVMEAILTEAQERNERRDYERLRAKFGDK
jgi:hypothetical protein